ncbi:conserved Plasmodium protein, unknown function [Plasmodium ovale curtisi]|uniref:PPM-type phosphatase domain-containing protein n=1 Tax=Plasmodium ovale curtisi TaxID=864141 RepID=A0A1A8XED4_PLAOA|nr:conserved Plasmodium protein, unknown function [Plasmodium ovale curtisi]
MKKNGASAGKHCKRVVRLRARLVRKNSSKSPSVLRQHVNSTPPHHAKRKTHLYFGEPPDHSITGENKYKMQQLLNRCLNVSTSDCGADGEENLLQTCKLMVGFGDGIDEVNCVNGENIDNDFICGFDGYAKKNCTEGLRISTIHGKKSDYINLNAYCENNFNKIFNIEYVDLPLLFYETIYINFYCSFFEVKEKEKIDRDVNTYVMINVYEMMKHQKYVLLHKANSIPHQKKKMNVSYKNGDALICSDNIIAIADGVSSIKNSGINVCNFSNELLKKCLNLYIYRCVNKKLFEEENRIIFKQYNLNYQTEEMLKAIVCRSACSSNFLGASTLLFSSIEDEMLHICTIGDCQMLIVRLKRNYVKDTVLQKVQVRPISLEEEPCLLKRESNFSSTLGYNSYDTKNEIKEEDRIGGLSISRVNTNLEKFNDGTSKSRFSPREFSYFGASYCESEKSVISPLISSPSGFSKGDSTRQSRSRDSSIQRSQSKVKNLYSKRKELCHDELFSNVSGMNHREEKTGVVLYIEEEVSEDIAEYFEKYLSSNNYKIGNISFVIRDNDLCTNSNERSDTGISQNFTHTTEYDFSDNEKKFISIKSTLDDSGYKNLLKLFTLDRTDILGNSKAYTHMKGSNEGEANHLIGINGDNDMLEGEINENGEHTMHERIYTEGKEKKENNINVTNNYRFRCNNEELRQFDIIYKSKIQQHYFNCPFQITFMPTNLSTNSGSTKSNITLKSNVKMRRYNDIISKCLRYCEYSTISVKENDIIISGSDGLFDNLYDDDIMEIVFNNFFIIKGMEFINLKRLLLFYDEYTNILNHIRGMMSNRINSGKKASRAFSGSTSNSLVVGAKHCGEEETPTSQIEHSGTYNCSDTDDNGSLGVRNSGLAHSTNWTNVKMVKEGRNIEPVSVKGNSHDYSKKKDEEDEVINMYGDNKKSRHFSKNKKKEINYFLNKKHQSNPNAATNKMKFSSKIKSMFSIKRKNKQMVTAQLSDKENEKSETIPSNESKNNWVGGDGGIVRRKVNSYAIGDNSTGSLSKGKTINCGGDGGSDSDIYSASSANYVHSELSVSRKGQKVWEFLQNYDHGKHSLMSDGGSDDLKFAHLNTQRKGRFASGHAAEKSHNDLYGEVNGGAHIALHTSGNKNECKNVSTNMSQSVSRNVNLRMNSAQRANSRGGELEQGRRQQTTETVNEDYTGVVRKGRIKTSDEWMASQNTLTEFSNGHLAKNKIPGNSEQNGFHMNSGRNLKKKKKIIGEIKIDCNSFFYESSDFILFDKDNMIYLNIKKACDEITELSTILANQDVNTSLLRKRRKKHKEKINMNSQKNEKGLEKMHTCVEKEISMHKNHKSNSGNASLNIYEKETYLFDKVNYDDIQSNKANDKIILTPISEFIFDKYKKYFNMGKPDDTTVIVTRWRRQETFQMIPLNRTEEDVRN